MKEDGEQKADDRGQRSEGRSQRSENMEAGLRPVGAIGAYAPEGMRPALVRLNWYKLLSFRLIVLMWCKV